MDIPAMYSVVPDFSLPDQHGQTVSLRDYRQRQPVVLILCDAACEPLLRNFALNYKRYTDAGVAVLALTPKAPAGQLPYPALPDADGRIIARYVRKTPALLILDSYNVLHGCLDGPWSHGPDHRAILEKITQIEMRCPECGLPEWPMSKG